MGEYETDPVDIDEFRRFKQMPTLINHWALPPGPRPYYWYLAFRRSPQLQALVARAQNLINFPFYDLVEDHGLHLTIDRIAYEDNVADRELIAIEAAARHACRTVKPFELKVGSLGGTPGAIGYSVHPVEPLQQLRTTLQAATLSVIPDAPVKRLAFRPHITIAYSNAYVPATQAIAGAEEANELPRVSVSVETVDLVLMERRERAYTWKEVTQIDLNGNR
ncbi:2'-5' RNA ligase family protein [Polymorphospora rubra]|uniref:2'-5' RNA ligase family protein n=1 Tax=Polymorphospora rubra TaxID=338584 RepID=UPI0033CECC0C